MVWEGRPAAQHRRQLLLQRRTRAVARGGAISLLHYSQTSGGLGLGLRRSCGLLDVFDQAGLVRSLQGLALLRRRRRRARSRWQPLRSLRSAPLAVGHYMRAVAVFGVFVASLIASRIVVGVGRLLSGLGALEDSCGSQKTEDGFFGTYYLFLLD